jgi:hypothetical protein
MAMTDIRTDWTREQIGALFELPFSDLLWQAQTVHRAHHDANAVQLSTLLSIKTGGCAENCGYCSQAAANNTDLKATKLMEINEVLAAARDAKANGSERFCMGAAWRSPKDRDMDAIAAMVEGVKAMGLETCMTLGMLSDEQAERLAEAGLDYYNHNLDSSPEYYEKVVTTRCYDDRLQTLGRVRSAGIKVCCGGIVGMGECRADRIGFIHALATLPAPSRKRADQRACPGGGYADWRPAEGHAFGSYRRYRIRPYRRRCAHHHAARGRATFGRAREHERGLTGALLPCWRQLDLYGRPMADGGQCRIRRRYPSIRKTGAEGQRSAPLTNLSPSSWPFGAARPGLEAAVLRQRQQRGVGL